MNKEEFLKYVKTPQWKADLEEAAKLIREGDEEAITAFISRGNKEAAEEAAYRIENGLDLPFIGLDDCVNRRLYWVRSRNLEIGVFRAEKRGFLGLRYKFGTCFVDTEFHFQTEAFNTAYPLKDLGIDLPEEIPLKETLGSVCSNCNKKAWWTGPPAPAPWACEGNCEKTRSYAEANKELFDFLKEHERSR